MLRIASDEATSLLAEGLLNAYESDRPEVEVILEPMSRAEILAGINAGDTHAGLLLGAPDEDVFYTPVAHETLVIVVHADNPVHGLTADEARALFNGRTASWREVGGHDQSVQVMVPPQGTSLRRSLDTLVLAGLDVSPSARLAADPQIAHSLVAATPGSVGWLSASTLAEGVKILSVNGLTPTPENVWSQLYPFGAPVVFVAQAEPSGDLRAFLDWIISPSGQRIVRRYMLVLGS